MKGAVIIVTLSITSGVVLFGSCTIKENLRLCRRKKGGILMFCQSRSPNISGGAIKRTNSRSEGRKQRICSRMEGVMLQRPNRIERHAPAPAPAEASQAHATQAYTCSQARRKVPSLDLGDPCNAGRWRLCSWSCGGGGPCVSLSG